MITVIGSVGHRNPQPTERFQLRYFELQTSIYDLSKANPVNFSINCYLSNGKRWDNVKIPAAGSHVMINAKIVGRTTDENRLAVRILDISYISKFIQTTPTSSPSKRADRWSGRADSNPSKKARYSAPEDPSVNRSPHTPDDVAVGPDQQLLSTINQTPSSPTPSLPPSTTRNRKQPPKH